MKKTIKKITEAILLVIACLSFVLMCGEKPDGSICLTWSLGWMAAFAVSAKILDKMGAFNEEESK